MSTSKHQIRFSSDRAFQQNLRSLQSRVMSLGLATGHINHIVSVAAASVTAEELGRWIETSRCCDMSAPLAESPDATFVRLEQEDANRLVILMSELLRDNNIRRSLRQTVHLAICAFSEYPDENLINSYRLYQTKTK